jgi:hypothetical protein
MLKIMRSFISLILIVLTFALLSECTFDEPVLPTWVTPFIIPLAKDRLVLAERFIQDTSLVTRGDSIFLDLHGSIESKSISPEDLRIAGVDTASLFSIESINLDSVTTLSTGTVNILEVLPALGNFVNQTIPFPDTVFSYSSMLTDTSSFVSMKVRNGTIQLTVYNNLPFTLAPVSQTIGSIEISVYNDELGTHVADISIPDTIRPGGVGIGSSPIASADSMVAMPLRLEYSVHTLADNIFISADSLTTWNFQIDLEFLNLEVEQIKGYVGTQQFDNEWHISVEDQSTKVIEARIYSGEITLVFYNRLPILTYITYTISDLQDNAERPYTHSFSIEPNDSSVQNISDLSGYRIINSQNPGQVIDSLIVTTAVSTDPGFVDLNATDEIQVRLQTSDILFNYLEGYLSQDTLDIEPFMATNVVDYDGFEGGFKLQGAQLIFEIDNQMDIETLIFNGDITAYRKDENGIYTDSATIPINNQPILSKNITRIVLEGPEVDSLVNILPTDFTASGNITYAGYTQVSTTDIIGGNYVFSTPFYINIVEPTSFKLKTDTIYTEDIDQKFRRASGEEIRSAILQAEVSNATPLTGKMLLFVNRNPLREDIYDTTGVIDTLGFYKTVNLPEAVVDPSTGFVEQPGEGTILITLNQQELDIFRKPPFRVGMQLVFSQTNGFVMVRSSDYIEFQGYAKITVLFKDEDK